MPARWRELADDQRRLGAATQAAVLEWCASDLEAGLDAWRLEGLTVARAAEESGYSESHLRALLSQGGLRNAGGDGSPRIRRADLPAKPSAAPPVLRVHDDEASLADKALARRLS